MRLTLTSPPVADLTARNFAAVRRMSSTRADQAIADVACVGGSRSVQG